MPDELDLNEVATFARVVEAGSFSAAAAQLGVPKSTVSRRVARLEERLGVRLIQRSTRRMHPTPEGERFHGRIASALQTLGEAGTEAREGSESPRGLLRITAPVDFGHVVLGGLLARFLEQYPEVSVSAVLTNRVVDLVGEGFDVALRGGSLKDSLLVARRLASTDSVLSASPAYLHAAGCPGHPREIASHRALLFRADGERQTWELEGPGGETHRTEARGTLTGDDFGFLVSAAEAGGGIALLPSFHVREPLRRGTLQRVLPGWRVRSGGLHLVYPSARHLAPKVRAFRDFLLETLPDFDDLDGIETPEDEMPSQVVAKHVPKGGATSRAGEKIA
ncbi:MAG: LysR family transcriptional regulator [Myxococcota bacterium]